jgi:hypothetical protein
MLYGTVSNVFTVQYYILYMQYLYTVQYYILYTVYVLYTVLYIHALHQRMCCTTVRSLLVRSVLLR